jgi:hypothetical protein
MTFDTKTDRGSSGFSLPPPVSADQPVVADGEPVFLELDGVDAGGAGVLVEPDTQSSPQPAAGKSAMPGWFSRKRARAAESQNSPPESRARKESLPAIVPTADDQPDTFWHEPTLLEKLSYALGLRPATVGSDAAENPRFERFKRLIAFAMTGYGFSLILHTLLTAALALIIIEKASPRDYSLLFANSEDEIVELDNTIDTALDLAGGADEQLQLPHLQVVETEVSDLLQPAVPDELRPKAPAVGDGEGGTEGDGRGPGFVMPKKGGNVVIKGSFTAWTIPEDPLPGQSYLIIVQVKLPKKVRRYRRRDLSGLVVGTDGYRQPIPGIRRGYLPMKDHQAQLVIQVPGAARLVEDTINVRSKMLKEKQTLKIVF